VYDIICYGTLCQDRIIRIPRYPELGRSVWIQEDTLAVGGEAANSAIALNAWGQRTLLLGTVLGRDDRGHWLLDRLSELDYVDSAEFTASHDADTPYCVIMATPDAERTMFGRYFREMRGQVVSELPEANVFTLDPYCGEGAISAAKAAKRQGLFTLAMDAIGRPEVAERADVIVTSYQEIAPDLAGGELLSAAAECARDVSKILVLTLGPDGSAAFGPDGSLLHRQKAVAVPPEQVADATGCGDVYRAGLACGYARGWPLEQSMAFASAAAALNLLGPGGGGHALSLDDTLEVARRGHV